MDWRWDMREKGVKDVFKVLDLSNWKVGVATLCWDAADFRKSTFAERKQEFGLECNMLRQPNGNGVKAELMRAVLVRDVIWELSVFLKWSHKHFSIHLPQKGRSKKEKKCPEVRMKQLCVQHLCFVLEKHTNNSVRKSRSFMPLGADIHWDGLGPIC